MATMLNLNGAEEVDISERSQLAFLAQNMARTIYYNVIHDMKPRKEAHIRVVRVFSSHIRLYSQL